MVELADLRSLGLHELHEDCAVYDDPVARVESGGNIVSIARPIAQSHVPAREAAVALDDIDKRQVLVVAQNPRNGDEKSPAFLTRFDSNAHIHLLLQDVAG